MITLDPHDGDLGMSAWVDCSQCLHDNRRPGWIGPMQPGWFAIRSGERHWIDLETRQHFHLACGTALVALGLAQVNPTIRSKSRMATVRLTRKKVAR